MQKYPEVATVKCINHTQYKTTPASELAPGFVTLALIPDLQKRSGKALDMPRFPKGDLDEMRDYLNQQANLFLNQPYGDFKWLQLVNPQYETLQIELEVKFRKGVDEALFSIKLSQELSIYLAPWRSNTNAAPTFGRGLRKSAIIRFVEDRPYIDYVEKMMLTKSGKVYPAGTGEGEDIRPEADHAILTTAPYHLINAKQL